MPLYGLSRVPPTAASRSRHTGQAVQNDPHPKSTLFGRSPYILSNRERSSTSICPMPSGLTNGGTASVSSLIPFQREQIRT